MGQSWSSPRSIRLGRDAHFLLGLEKAGVDFVAADMPAANRLTVGIMAMVADEERRMISKRTKEALAAAKRRGVKLGGYRGAKITRKISRGGQCGHCSDRLGKGCGPGAGHCRVAGGRRNVAAGYCGRTE